LAGGGAHAFLKQAVWYCRIAHFDSPAPYTFDLPASGIEQPATGFQHRAAGNHKQLIYPALCEKSRNENKP